jgi:hypothetical protein
MKKYVALAIGILVLTFFSSCSAGDRSFQNRRDFAIQFNKNQLASTKNEVQAKWEKDILFALASTDTKTINSPKVSSAILVSRKNGAYGLFVFWIENDPSVDGVGLRLSNQSSSVIIPIPEQELKQIRAMAKDTIVFGSEYDWPTTSELSKSLDQITNAKDLKIRLVRAKAPLTDWFPVDLYKAGRWISDIVTNK